MKFAIRRNLSTSTLAFLGLALSMSTGCGALSAIGNPGAMWAVNDPASLNVVVRRADAAQLTTIQVDRLLTATPTGKDTDWTLNVAPDPKIAAADLKALTQDPEYMKTRARIVESEVWIRTLPEVQAASGEHPNLLAAIDPSLADSYAAIVAKQQEIAGIEIQIDVEKTAAGAPDVTPADKKTHQDTVAQLQKQEDDDDKQIEPMKKSFIAQVKDASAKVSPDDQKRFIPAVASLLQALADADISNSAAAIKFPLVVKTLPDAVKVQVPMIAGDVIEEQTGARPSLAALKVKIDINGSSVSVGVDGLGDLGNLNVADATSEIVKRSVTWATHAVTLLASISSTKNTINFERDVLNQMLTAWTPAAGSSIVVIKIPAYNSPEVMAAVAAPSISIGGKAHAKAAVATSSVAVVEATGPSATVGIGVGVGGSASVKGGAKGGAAVGAAGKKPDPKAAAATAGKKPAAPAKKDDKKDKK